MDYICIYITQSNVTSHVLGHFITFSVSRPSYANDVKRV